MIEQFSPKDPYEVQVAWDTIMTAVKEIRVEQNWPDSYIAKTLRGIADSLDDTTCLRGVGRTNGKTSVPNVKIVN